MGGNSTFVSELGISHYYVFCIPIDYLLPCRLHLHGSKYTHHTRELTRTVHIYGFQGRQRSGPLIRVDPISVYTAMAQKGSNPITDAGRLNNETFFGRPYTYH